MGLRDPVVCIVGAGPAGLVTAHLLQRAGISFVVLERREADGPRGRVKAGLIEHRTVELLGPYGLADPIAGRGGRVGMIEFRADARARALRLGSYTRTRLPHVWRHQEFSNLMLSLFNAGTAGGHAARDFSYGLRRARLELIVRDPQFSRWFARAYAGVDDQE